MTSTSATSGALLYRPDWLAARTRLTDWWNGGDIGRAAMQIMTPRPTPVEHVPEMATPDGVRCAYYSTKSLAHRVYVAQWWGNNHQFFGEACPASSPGDLAPNCLALYLGCEGIEGDGTVWVRPFIAEEDPAVPALQYDADNFNWQFSQSAHRAFKAQHGQKMLQQFPDLIEGLDTLEGMRGADKLLEDLYDRPEWVQACLKQITQLYFHYYDMLYDIIRDEVGGSVFWSWAPGRMAKFQCDFSAMISPSMFGEFMVPVLREMTERVSYCMYHWDGPGAIPHHDHLLGLPELDMIQWTPGAGEREYILHPDWIPLYHKTLEAGKKLHLGGLNDADQLRFIKREFGELSKQMLLNVNANSPQQAEEFLAIMEC